MVEKAKATAKPTAKAKAKEKVVPEALPAEKPGLKMTAHCIKSRAYKQAKKKRKTRGRMRKPSYLPHRLLMLKRPNIALCKALHNAMYLLSGEYEYCT